VGNQFQELAAQLLVLPAQLEMQPGLALLVLPVQLALLVLLDRQELLVPEQLVLLDQSE
jgi:hypothetical protein